MVTTMQRADMIVPTSELDHDVPLDREHVELLKASLKERGQLAPILVWIDGNQIIDGFHRLTALKELGIPEALITVIGCSEEEYIDSRVVSAVMHKGISFARIVLWMQEAFAKTQWASKVSVREAFTAPHIKLDPKLQSREQGLLRKKGLLDSEIAELAQWVNTKAAAWGLNTQAVQTMLRDADGASPRLIAQVRPIRKKSGYTLTRSALQAVASEVYDHDIQEALIRKAKAERLDVYQLRDLARIVGRASSKEVSALLVTSWLDIQKKHQPVSPSKHVPQYVEDTGSVFHHVRSIEILLKGLTNQPESNKIRVEEILTELLSHVGRFLRVDSGEPIAMLLEAHAKLLKAYQVLLAEKQILERKVQASDHVLNLGRQIYNEDNN